MDLRPLKRLSCLLRLPLVLTYDRAGTAYRRSSCSVDPFPASRIQLLRRIPSLGFGGVPSSMSCGSLQEPHLRIDCGRMRVADRIIHVIQVKHGSNRTAKILRRLLTEVPRGAPLDTARLAGLGVTPALAHQYVRAGWLPRLGRGVFQFPNDLLRQEDCLRFLAARIKGFPVGGKTALAWRGYGHNVPTREPLCLFGGGEPPSADLVHGPVHHAVSV